MADKEQAEYTENLPDNQSNETEGADENQDQSVPVEADKAVTEKLRSELEESKDKYLRLVAEFDNFRRRSARERIETLQTAGREILNEMLPVLDDIDRAQRQLESTEDIAQIREGVSLVFNKFRNTVGSKGLKPMETVGKEFDADLHEAVTEIPAPTEDLKGKVVDEVSKGYYLNDKIIRHAKVVVGK